METAAIFQTLERLSIRITELTRKVILIENEIRIIKEKQGDKYGKVHL